MFIANRISLCRHLTQQLPTTAAHRCMTNVATATSSTDELDPRKIIEKQLACKVKVNKKKTWSSTAVLEALEETIGSSPTPGYDMLSSPHFHISNQRKHNINFKKRGEEAANFAIANIEDSFKHSWDSDNVALWLNTPSQQLAAHSSSGDVAFDEDMLDESEESPKVKLDFSVENIVKAIEMNQMEMAVRIYSKLRDQNVEISDDVTSRLFAYVAFYLGSSENKNVIEQQPINPFYNSSKICLNPTLVDRVFKMIEKPTQEQYNVYIRTLFYFQRFDEAIAVYTNHMKGTDMQLDVDSINALLISILRTRNTNGREFRTAKCVKLADSENPRVKETELFRHMNEKQIRPNHDTFFNLTYNVLYASDIEGFSRSCDSLFNEMKHCGLEIVPQIYGEIVRTATGLKASRDTQNDGIDMVLDMIEQDNQLICHTPKDATAFSSIMRLLGNRKDLERVKRFYRIVTSGNKRRIMKNISYEEFFYSYYMFALLRLDTLENIWLAKCQLTPTKCRFTSRHIQLFYDAIKREEAYEYLPLLVADLMKDSRATAIVHDVFDYVVENWEEIVKDEQTATQFKHISLINFKSPNFVLKLPRTTRPQDIKRQQELVLNRSLQILARCGDAAHMKFALQRLEKFDMQLTEESLADCEKVREKHRLDELLKRIERSDE